MDYHISERMKPLKPSAIREILKYGSDPEVISLAAGDPAPTSLPLDEIKRIVSSILEEDPMKALLYSQSEGYPPLREAVAKLAHSRYDAMTEADDLIITSGAQQGIELVAKVVCNEGDTIICEDPSFVGALNAFRSYRINLAGVPMEEDGIQLDKLEEALQNNPKARVIYLIPNFQNPTGITMSLEKRKKAYELAKKYKVLILEDNPYGDLRFEGEELPSIKSFDTEGIVLYAGTFSKILSTGIRVGYLVMPKGLSSKIVVAKQCSDVHTSMLAQLLCHRYLEDNDLAAHIESAKVIYQQKCGLMLDTMEKHFPTGVTWTKPQGGLFIWCTLPEGMDSSALALRLVQEKKVCIVPGTAFDANPDQPTNTFRMNFSMPSEENIVTGVTRLGALLREMME